MVLGRRTAVSGTWMVGARLVSRLIDLVTMLVLAHILLPKDFGLVAIAMTVIYIIEAALELPVSQALVRLEIIEPAHYDTAFTLSLLRGLALGLIVCTASWPFARFYADLRLLPLVCVLSVAPAARGLVSPRLADFSRNLDFSPDFIMEIVGKSTACCIAIILGIATRSYWAIAAATVVSPVASTATSYVLAPYRPRLDFSALPAFSGFLGWITAAQVVSALNWQTDRMMLGKLTSKAELGLFTTANDFATIPVMALLTPILRPLLAAFSLVKDDPGRRIHSYQRSATGMVTLGLPILIGESLLAHPAVRLVFGQQWLASATLLRWLAISLIPTLFAMPFAPLVMSFDCTHVFFKRNLLELGVKMPLILVGAIKYGFMGVIVARCISESVTVLFCMTVVRQLIGLPIHRQLLGPWRSFISVAAMAAVVRLASPMLTSTDAVAPLAAGLVLVAILGAATYCVVLGSLWITSGCPAGLESMMASEFAELMRRGRRLSAQSVS